MKDKNSYLILKSLALFIVISVVKGQCPSGTTGYNCQACPDGCDNCDTNPATCDTCSTGYYIDSSNLCLACPSNCLACSTPYVCTTCTPGYDTTINSDGYEQCYFNWVKWFLIIFGILLGIFLIGLLIYCVRQKLKEEDTKDQQIQYEMQKEATQEDVG